MVKLLPIHSFDFALLFHFGFLYNIPFLSFYLYLPATCLSFCLQTHLISYASPLVQLVHLKACPLFCPCLNIRLTPCLVEYSSVFLCSLCLSAFVTISFTCPAVLPTCLSSFSVSITAQPSACLSLCQPVHLPSYDYQPKQCCKLH